MAIVAHTFVPHASKDDADRFDASVEAAMMQLGGPPQGLMVHLTYPTGDGFTLCNVWRTEGDMAQFYEQVILPKLAEAGLAHEHSAVTPVWGLARP